MLPQSGPVLIKTTGKYRTESLLVEIEWLIPRLRVFIRVLFTLHVKVITNQCDILQTCGWK